MNKILRFLLLAFSVLSITTVADASTFDFKAQAEAGGLHGEGGWTILHEIGSGFTLDVSVTKNGNNAFAYLDAGNAGLGVCGALLNGLSADVDTHSGSNRCSPDNDDNVTSGEILKFVFSSDVVIDTIWFNNNHDGDTSLVNNNVNIGGPAYFFASGGAGVDSFTTIPYFVSANTPFFISYNDEEFYVSKMAVHAVPEPASLMLMGIGLTGLAVVVKRKH